MTTLMLVGATGLVGGAVDGVICTLGTTIRNAGSQEAFRRVDYDCPLVIARLTR